MLVLSQNLKDLNGYQDDFIPVLILIWYAIQKYKNNNELIFNKLL